MEWRKPRSEEVGMGGEFFAADFVAECHLNGHDAKACKVLKHEYDNSEFVGCTIGLEWNVDNAIWHSDARLQGLNHEDPEALDNLGGSEFTVQQLVDAGFEVY